MAEAAFQFDFFGAITSPIRRSEIGSHAKETGLIKSSTAIAKRGEKVDLSRISAKEKALRDERWLYCRLVVREKEQTRQKFELCCENVAIRSTHLFPLLITGGKGGKSALNYHNCRDWLKQLRGGTKVINWDNKNVLLSDWKGGRDRAGDPIFWRLFFATYLNRNNFSVAQAYRMAAKRMRDGNQFTIVPRMHQVTYQVGKLNPLVVANARLGPVWVRENMLSHISRDWSEVLPNQIWFADHRVSDFLIRVWDEKEQCWYACRPWMCVYFDAKSWHVISVQILETAPNSWVVRNGLAVGVAHYGRPNEIYVDNGKDFLVHGFGRPVTFSMNDTGTEVYEHSILKELSIGMTNSLPYNGRAKCVERFFGYISRGFDKLFPGYLSNIPATRPGQAELYFKHENAHLLPNQNELCEMFNEWLEEYHNTPIEGKILEGKSPAEAFAIDNRLQRAPMNANELFAAFLKPVNRLHTVQRGPSVFFGKEEYRGGNELYQYFKKKVMLKADANDLTHVYAFEPNGKFICECKTKPQVAAFAKTDQERKLLKSELAVQRRQAKLGRTMVRQITGGFEKLDPLTLYSLPLEMLDEPAKLKLIASKSSVKGSDHNPKIYQIKSAAETEENAGLATSAPRVPFRHEVKAAEQREFEEKFDAMMTKKKQTEPREEFADFEL